MRLLSIFLFFASMQANPFVIDFPEKKDLSHEDLEAVQQMLRQKSICDELDRRYPSNWRKPKFWQKRVIYDDFKNRLERGFRQTLIDRSNNLLPENGLITLNGGGEDCIVLYASLDRVYPNYLRTLIQGLDEVGFKGNVYYRIGGYPNPTGEEIRYAGVPYAFKLFMLEEAKNLGFRYLLWLDASLYPIKSITPLIERLHAIGMIYKQTTPRLSYMLPKTQEEIFSLTGIDVLKVPHLRMPVFGIDTHLDWFEDFLEEHKKMVRLGTPFLSCLPEEYVLTALKEKYFATKIEPSDLLVGFDYVPSVKNGYYFYLRFH
jgi:hypothetical protein